jgi:hypothetical protein
MGCHAGAAFMGYHIGQIPEYRSDVFTGHIIDRVLSIGQTLAHNCVPQ